MASLSSIYIFWYREVLRIWRDKIRVVGSLAMPLLWLLVFGAGFSRLVQVGPGVDFAKFMFPGIVGMTVLMTSFMSGVSIVWERELGFLKEVLVAPVPRSTIVIGKALGSATVSMFQGSLVLGLAPLLGVKLTPMLVFKLWPLMALVALTSSALGILVASRMKSMEGFQLIMQATIMPMLFLSGVFFPVNSLPPWMGLIVKVNPITYAVDAIRQVALAGEAALQDVASVPWRVTVYQHTMTVLQDTLVVVAFGIVMGGLAVWSFGRQD
ncbi:MAG: ABC transporter permease [Chloroflexi bacterium]|nr:ABC transporter permease [Chloroflexota bacterium]